MPVACEAQPGRVGPWRTEAGRLNNDIRELEEAMYHTSIWWECSILSLSLKSLSFTVNRSQDGFGGCYPVIAAYPSL